MPPKVEMAPPPPPESVKPPEKVAPGKGENPEIIKAKRRIEEITSKKEEVRLKAIENLRNPTLKSLEIAKADLATAPMKEVEWLVKPDDIQHSPEVAVFAAKIAGAGDLKDDPRWLLSETIELAYSIRADATPEARREVNAAIARVGQRLEAIMQSQPDLYAGQGIEASSFHEAMYGGSMAGILPLAENVFKEDKPEEETVTDPEIIRLLREINKKIRTNPEYLSDSKYLEKDILELQQKANERGVPENQVREALSRLIEKKNDVEKAMRAEDASDRYGDYLVRYEDVMQTIPEADRLTGERLARKEPFPFDRRNFSKDDILLLTSGEAGQREYFSKFVTEIFTMGKTFDRPGLPEEMQFDQFKKFISWLHPENTEYYLNQYDIRWKELPRHYQLIKELLFMPGDVTDKLKNLRRLSGADLDFYAKTFRGGNYAISLYEDVVRDLLTERRMDYESALQRIKTDPGLLKRYRELMQRQNKGETLNSEEQQWLARVKKETIDPVGYGVMLYDEDIQNYAELDLEVNEMSHELDSLLLKQDALREKGENLSELEIERMERLNKEIAYKRKESQDIKAEEKSLHKEHSEDMGLSKVDLEVKRRLRLILQDRDPTKKVGEWELNAAVWAARQYMMGSSRLVSMNSEMAIRPAFEYVRAIDEINWGKFIMKAPAFEDIQRVLNPDLFADRFGMGSEMGDLFRAKLNRSLLEAQGHVFKHSEKYRVQEEIDKGVDPVIRETKEFIRQVCDETGMPYTEMVIQGYLKTGGNFDASNWRAEIGMLDELKKKYLNMQEQGQLPPDAKFENQALGIQYAMAGTPERKKAILDTMMKRTPNVILQFLGGRDMDALYHQFGLGEKTVRDRFRRALSVAQINTWDRNQSKDSKDRPFRDFDFVGTRTDFDEILSPFFQKEGFSEGQIDGFFAFLGKAKDHLDLKKNELVKNNVPITFTLSDLDFKDSEMFKIGTAGMDRRARDMGAQAGVREAVLKFSTDPVLLCTKDTKEPLKVLKQIRDTMNAHTDAKSAEQVAYQVAKQWLNFNRNRHIFYENREGNFLGAVKGRLRTVTGWIPLWHPLQKSLSEMDTSRGWMRQIATLEVGKKGSKRKVFGDAGEKFAKRLDLMPRKIAEDISFAVRFTGAKGNAFEEKQLDEILDQMLQMGIFNADEKLYHQLRREMHATLGDQAVGLVRKYWWVLPLLTAAYGAKEGLEEEKKR